jgi:Gas vesicle synthesis protein GvpL/GvpF
MPVHLYGVLETEAIPAARTRGLDGRAVRVLPLGVRLAWVSEVSELPQRLREHDAVLGGAIAAGYSVVPSLFGRLHANDASLIAALEESAAALDAAMALVRGRIEMSFLVAPSGTAPVPEAEKPLDARGPGHEHLRRIRNRVHAERILRDRALEFTDSATRVISDLLVAERVMEHPAPPVLAARAHLVARDDMARYLRAAKLQAAGAGPGLRVAVRGPGAAYSFAAVQIG